MLLGVLATGERLWVDRTEVVAGDDRYVVRDGVLVPAPATFGRMAYARHRCST